MKRENAMIGCHRLALSSAGILYYDDARVKRTYGDHACMNRRMALGPARLGKDILRSHFMKGHSYEQVQRF